MTATIRPLFAFDNSFARELDGLCAPWAAAQAPAPELLAFNEALATELGLDPEAARSPAGVAVLVGNAVPEGAQPVAQAYAGHQFGHWSPRLGDGRALLVGELHDTRGQRRDLHLKGSGRTPFARGGDGRAAVGPMLREYLMGEAMHALGVPTTRALAVVATGEQIVREQQLPGAVLARVAASHLRVGMFQYAAALDDPAQLRRLADHAIARHHPGAAGATNAYAALLERVVDAQASLVAHWMLIGFVHGVMNTDNVTISGETIDYGPCAFMDAVDLRTVFSSIDHQARYAFGNQPGVTRWNLTRFAEALLPLLHDDQDTAVAVATGTLGSFADRYDGYWRAGMAAKLGLADPASPADPAPLPDAALIDDLLALLAAQRVDFTMFFRALSGTVRGDDGPRARFVDPTAFDAWSDRWRAAMAATPGDPAATAAAMDRVNPVYIPRNHLVEEALAAATGGDLGPFRRLNDVLARPFDVRPGLERYALPDPAGSDGYRTFCGT